MPSLHPIVKHRKEARVKITEFKIYPKLPLELKNMIVRLATPSAPKVVTIGYKWILLPNCFYELRAIASYDKPVFLAVDKSSRETVLKMFTTAFTINLGGVPVYFNFKTDALFFKCRQSMQIFNGWDPLGFHEGFGPSPNQYPILMVGYECLDFIGLSPSILQKIGTPEYITFLHKSGHHARKCHKEMAQWMADLFESSENRGEEITKSYKAPVVSFKTPLQLLKLLDTVKKRNIEDDTRRAKQIETARDIRVFN